MESHASLDNTLLKPQVTANGEEQEDGRSSSEINDRFEVVLDKGASYRRKDSLTDSTIHGPRLVRPTYTSRSTSCFVHGLLQHEKVLQGSNVISETAERDESVHRKQDKDPFGEREPGSTGLPSVAENVAGSSEALKSMEESSQATAHTQSRLFTKKEISDLAFSIRELSKRLGRFKIKVRVRNVFLLTKAHDETLIAYTREVAEWLLKQDGAYTVWVEDTLEQNKAFDATGLRNEKEQFKGRMKFWNIELCRKQPHTFDIILALGGDGTVLYASWLFQRVVPPVLAFALGSLGFLTKFDFGQFRQTLTETFEHGLTVSLRLRLEATVMRSQRSKSSPHGDLVEELIGEQSEDHHTHKPETTHDILNDLVLDRGPNPTMSSIEVFGDNYHITTVQADGVCVATPTGSTAYNLAAGGSLCHPDNPVVLVTAICAHTLSFRPIILPDTIVLRLGVPYDGRASSWVSFDGKERAELHPGDYITISASRYPFPTVLPLGKGGEDWIDSLSKTLNWNSRQRQKAFKEWKQ